MTKLLIDGDVLAYRAGFATEKTKYLVSVANEFATRDTAKEAQELLARGYEHVWSRKELEPVEQALTIVDVMIGDIRARYADENPSLNLYLSGVGNFRHGIATRASYKGNRDGSVPPTHLKAIRKHLVDKWGAELSAGEEADDLIGIAATASADNGMPTIICSIDKDLMQLPGRHYNFVTKEEVTVSNKQAALNFFAQCLSGDPVDNVPGVTGIGPVKARKALEGCGSPFECWSRIVDVYYGHYGPAGEAMAIEAAKLVFVRRYPNQEWSPPKHDEAPKAEALGKKKASR